MLDRVVLAEVVQREPGRIGDRHGFQGSLEEEVGQGPVEVDGLFQRVKERVSFDVPPVVREVPVIRQSVHHGTGASGWTQRYKFHSSFSSRIGRFS